MRIKVEFVINVNGKELSLSEEEAKELYKVLNYYFQPAIPPLYRDPIFIPYKAGEIVK